MRHISLEFMTGMFVGALLVALVATGAMLAWAFWIIGRIGA